MVAWRYEALLLRAPVWPMRESAGSHWLFRYSRRRMCNAPIADPAGEAPCSPTIIKGTLLAALDETAAMTAGILAVDRRRFDQAFSVGGMGCEAASPVRRDIRGASNLRFFLDVSPRECWPGLGRRTCNLLTTLPWAGLAAQVWC